MLSDLLAPSIETFILIFVTVDPLGLMPVFASVTSGLGMSKQDLRSICIRATLISLVTLIIFWMFGAIILGAFGIGMNSFQIIGGFFLIIIAYKMIFGTMQEQRQQNLDAAINDEFLSSIATFPLALPMIAGPSTITLTIFLADKASTTSQSQLIAFLPIAAVILLAAISMWIASELTSKIGPNILIIHQKIFGLLLGAIAIEFVIEGLKATFPVLL
jgi:multiple antibiotic resistance protein